MTVQAAFARFASASAIVVGSPWFFAATALAMAAWFSAGPYMHYSDTWQLLANTTTTLMTTLIVILIQNSQNRGERALHLKIDELIRVNRKAHNALIGIERREEGSP